MPMHIDFLSGKLKALNNVNVSNNLVLDVFAEVVYILSRIRYSQVRHPDTITFYQNKSIEYKILTFPAVLEAYAQKQYESYVNEQMQIATINQQKMIPVLCPTDQLQQYGFSPYPLATLPPSYQETISNNYQVAEELKLPLYPVLTGYPVFNPETIIPENKSLYPVTDYNPASVKSSLFSDELFKNESYSFIQVEETPVQEKVVLPLELFVSAAANQAGSQSQTEAESVYQSNADITFSQTFPEIPKQPVSLAKSNIFLRHAAQVKQEVNRQQEKVKVLAM